jgi:hypothetical protein
VIMVRWAVVEIDDVLAFGEFQHLSPCISLHWPVLDVSMHPSGDIRVPSCPHNRILLLSGQTHVGAGCSAADSSCAVHFDATLCARPTLGRPPVSEVPHFGNLDGRCLCFDHRYVCPRHGLPWVRISECEVMIPEVACFVCVLFSDIVTYV